MGIEFLIAGAIFLATSIITYALYKPNLKQPTVKASGIDDFNITRASEGLPHPIVFGRVKITGNIVWYGNLLTKKQKTDTGGGSGGGGEVTTGYHYYLDCWQTICRGPARILGVYKDNKKFLTEEINPVWSGYMVEDGDGKQTTTITINKGNGVSNFTLDLEYFAPIPTICSANMTKVFCGSATSFPAIHWEVQCDFYSQWSNPANGWNPANAVYYILTDAGVDPVDIDWTSFTNSASYWYNKGYGINMVIGSQSKVRENIEKILAPLGGFYFESGGKHYLNPADPYEVAWGTITDDFKKFVISRRSWEDTVNDIKATFTEQAKDYTERTAVVQNPASINMLGRIYTKTYDLSLFSDLGATQKRLGEMIKSESYPYAEVEFITDLSYMNLLEGSIVNVTNSEIGVVNMGLRIIRKSLENIDSNEINFHGIQVAETLFDDKWVNIGTGSSNWSRELQPPIPLTKYRIMEIPRNTITDKPTILILAAKENNYEVEFNLYYTPDGNNYSLLQKYSAFNMYATLKTEYSASTYQIDDSATGIHVQYFKPDYDIDSLTRSGLFASSRFLVINNEIMKFQTVILNEDGTANFTGVMRGVYNTTPATHAVNSVVWIVDDPDCFWTPPNGVISGYYKICPRNLISTLPVTSAAAISVSPSTLAGKPFAVSRVSGVRSGSNVNFLVSVRDMTSAGAGISPSTNFVTGSDTDVVIEWKLSTDSAWTILPVQVGTFSVNNSGSFTVNVRAKEFGIYTAIVNLTVGTTDGTYTV